MGYFSEQDNKPKRVTLVSDESYWVDVVGEMTWKQSKNFYSGDAAGEAPADQILLSSITEWNLDDESGNVLPITQENIDRLKQVDVVKIIEAMNLTTSDAEKKSSSKQ